MPASVTSNYAALVLAAGSASRFGSDKLSATLDGMPLVQHAIRAARAAPVRRVVLVARPGLSLEVPANGTDAPPVEILRVQSTALSTSLKAGIAAIGDVDGLFVFLGDMPRVPHREAARLAAMLDDNFAALPRHQGRPGHPVLLSARALPHLATLTGDRGAGQILRGREDIAWDNVEDPAVLLDIDTPDELAALTRQG